MNTRMKARHHRQKNAGRGSFPAAGPALRGVEPAAKNNLLSLAQRLSLLTAREMEVLRLLGGWQRKEEFVSFLGISPRTVEAHRARLRKNRGLSSLPELFSGCCQNHDDQSFCGQTGKESPYGS